MAERIILCSSCGTKNRITAPRPVACEGCDKPLIVRVGLLGRLSRVRWGSVFWVSVIALITAAYLHNPSLVATENASHQNSASARPNIPEMYPSMRISAQAPIYISPGLVNPPRNPSLARLTVETRRGANYYIKLVNHSTGAETMSFYVRGGEPLTVNVPVGTYELRYAVGQVWYGPTSRFGPGTEYVKAEHFFNFTVTPTPDGLTYSVWRIELILQTGGNLETMTIDESEF